MKDFDDLIEAKDKAVADEEECAKAEHEAFHVHADAQQKHSESVDVLAECHKAIHDVLAEKGEHYGIDQSTGTVTVYKPIDEPPGWCAVHPIPGRTKTAETKKQK